MLSEDDYEENQSESASNADSAYYNMPAINNQKLSWLDSAKIRYGIHQTTTCYLFLQPRILFYVLNLTKYSNNSSTQQNKDTFYVKTDAN